MDKPVEMHPDINKGAEIGNIRDYGGKLHSRINVFRLLDSFFELNNLKLIPRVPPRFAQFFINIA